MRPLVSAIIPAFNRGRYIAEAVASVLAQTYGEVEAVVVDDGSTDDTPDVVKALAAGGERVTFLQQHNLGPSAARNAGMAAARGPLLALLDSDDRWLPRKLEEQVPLLDDPAVGLVHSGIRCFRDADGSALSEQFPGANADFHALLAHEGLKTQTLLFRREVVDAVGGFDADYPPAEDWEFSLRVARQFGVRGLDEVHAEIRIHDDQISGDADKLFGASLAVLRRHGGAHGNCAACRRAVRAARHKLRAIYYPHLNYRARRAAAAGRYASAAWLGLRALWQQPQALVRGLTGRRQPGETIQ